MYYDEKIIDDQINKCHSIIDWAVTHEPSKWCGLLSGGHDSVCACHIASLHPLAPKPFDVYMIDTGIGSNYTKEYAKERAKQFGWNITILKSPNEKDTIENFVRKFGMPGPGMHSYVYSIIKERVIQKLQTEFKIGQRPVMFISGVRKAESQRRMGYAKPIKRGNGFYKGGQLRNPNRLFVAPCINWEIGNQILHMEEFGIPRNKVKDLIGLSGECFCGSFAQENIPGKPSELEIIKKDPLLENVKLEIERLENIAKDLNLPCKWGERPPKQIQEKAEKHLKDIQETMDLCMSCQK